MHRSKAVGKGGGSKSGSYLLCADTSTLVLLQGFVFINLTGSGSLKAPVASSATSSYEDFCT